MDEFLKGTAKKDIPDALAMILEYEPVRGGHKPYCDYKPWKPRAPRTSLTEQRKQRYHAEHYQQSNTDWWDSTLHNHGF